MPIMVTLRNIKRTNDYISADYYPEEADEVGYMRMSLATHKVVEHRRVGCMSPAHVKHALDRISKMETVPDVHTEIWY